jgi:hypothetical protein
VPGPFRRRNPTLLKPWYEQDYGARLEHDQQLLVRSFPGLVYVIDNKVRQVTLAGAMTLRTECGIPTEIRVRVVFLAYYPSQEPRAYDVEDRFPHSADRHFYPDGQCCLWLPSDSGWNPTDTEGLCRWLEEVAIFFDRQLVLEAEGKDTWPGEQRPHGDAGYLQLERVEEVKGRVGIIKLRTVFLRQLSNNLASPKAP